MSIARTKYKVTKSLLLLGILCTGLLSGFIGLVAYFGQYMGTFVISLDDATTNLGITLSEDIDFSNPSSRLLVNPINEAYPTTFNDINFVKAIESDGNMNVSKTNDYISFTFYVRNEGNVAVDIELDMITTTVTNNVDSAVRIVLIEDGNVDENGKVMMNKGNIYIKDENNQDERAVELLDDDKMEIYNKLTPELFTNDSILDNYLIDNFKPGDIKKYTLLIWLEGWDADCNDSIKYGQLKMKLIFSIRNLVNEEEIK